MFVLVFFASLKPRALVLLFYLTGLHELLYVCVCVVFFLLVVCLTLGAWFCSCLSRQVNSSCYISVFVAFVLFFDWLTSQVTSRCYMCVFLSLCCVFLLFAWFVRSVQQTGHHQLLYATFVCIVRFVVAMCIVFLIAFANNIATVDLSR